MLISSGCRGEVRKGLNAIRKRIRTFVFFPFQRVKRDAARIQSAQVKKCIFSLKELKIVEWETSFSSFHKFDLGCGKRWGWCRNVRSRTHKHTESNSFNHMWIQKSLTFHLWCWNLSRARGEQEFRTLDVPVILPRAPEGRGSTTSEPTDAQAGEHTLKPTSWPHGVWQAPSAAVCDFT